MATREDLARMTGTFDALGAGDDLEEPQVPLTLPAVDEAPSQEPEPEPRPSRRDRSARAERPEEEYNFWGAAPNRTRRSRYAENPATSDWPRTAPRSSEYADPQDDDADRYATRNIPQALRDRPEDGMRAAYEEPGDRYSPTRTRATSRQDRTARAGDGAYGEDRQRARSTGRTERFSAYDDQAVRDWASSASQDRERSGAASRTWADSPSRDNGHPSEAARNRAERAARRQAEATRNMRAIDDGARADLSQRVQGERRDPHAHMDVGRTERGRRADDAASAMAPSRPREAASRTTQNMPTSRSSGALVSDELEWASRFDAAPQSHASSARAGMASTPAAQEPAGRLEVAPTGASIPGAPAAPAPTTPATPPVRYFTDDAREARIAELRDRMAQTTRRRNELCARLGQSLYEATRENPILRMGREELYDGIAGCDAERAAYQQRIDEISAAEQAARAAVQGYECPRCHFRLGAQDRFCGGCGLPIADVIAGQSAVQGGANHTVRRCPVCGGAVGDDDAFCMHCGTSLG